MLISTGFWQECNFILYGLGFMEMGGFGTPVKLDCIPKK